MSSWQDDLSKAWKNDIEFLRIVSELSGLSIALWPTGKPLSSGSWTSCENAVHPCFTQETLRSSLEEYCRSDGPSIYFENDQILYGVMPIGAFALAIGPIAVRTASESKLQTYASDHGMERPIPIPRKDLGFITRLMKLLHLHFTGAAIPREEIPVTNEVLAGWHSIGALEEYQLDQSENDREHQRGVDFENDLLRAVQKGDPGLIKALLAGPTPDYTEIGELSDEQNKANEYLVVSVITLLTRAAVAGGVSVEAAHELGDVYLKRLSRAVLRKEPFLALSYQAMIEFAEQVLHSKEEKSSLSYVDACKEYIEKNLRKNLQVGDIAPAIGLSRTYLSRLFHQAEGITVQQYIQKEKCRHAAQMLQYSDHSISQIAQYLGFSSQSYFGYCFQTWYGMTPNAYRKMNH